ncbi:FMN-dependent NADH-azoreductase [Mycoplasma todarodis]|uniref:FMN-dependent NADH-azoreductase n=1 Tax=Mycoplasma todarodis TaxID=1937191 RepID=A0A4R0XLT3_9MOLU|nr:FMN-dependent NADH-azoreductase [Mycoplasma todarodis]TCG11643.1 FMN-dependent NADH-azoreductase [Mycoplasma todarodis]
MKTLFITTTMTKNTPKGSISLKALAKFKELYELKYPDHETIWMDLNDQDDLSVGMTSENFETFFDDSDKYINLLKSVDKLVISVPMTNFSYTAQMKNLFDKICVAGKTFKYKYDGKGESEGLLTNLEVQIIAVQGAPEGWYAFSNFIPAMEGTWEFLGAKVMKTIQIDGVKTSEKMKLTVDENVELVLDKIKERV